jgi:hypothetical protein
MGWNGFAGCSLELTDWAMTGVQKSNLHLCFAATLQCACQAKMVSHTRKRAFVKF